MPSILEHKVGYLSVLHLESQTVIDGHGAYRRHNVQVLVPCQRRHVCIYDVSLEEKRFVRSLQAQMDQCHSKLIARHTRTQEQRRVKLLLKSGDGATTVVGLSALFLFVDSFPAALLLTRVRS